MCCEQPFMRCNMTAFVQRTNCCGEWFLTLAALINAWARAFAAKLSGAIDAAAVRAHRAIGPTQPFEVNPCGVYVVEDRIGEIYGHLAPLSCYLHSALRRGTSS